MFKGKKKEEEQEQEEIRNKIEFLDLLGSRASAQQEALLPSDVDRLVPQAAQITLAHVGDSCLGL